MQQFDFDHPPERRGSDSIKWRAYGPDVLPLWVADMDFRAPPAVLQALEQRIQHGVFGYGGEETQLANLICTRLQSLYQWDVHPDEVLFVPGLVSALNLVCKALCPPSSGVLVQSPIYPPFLSAPSNQGFRLQVNELVASHTASDLRYHIDFSTLAQDLAKDIALMLFCNPHNPVGRCYTREELQQVAALCLQHKVVICADEIHCDLLLDSKPHIPIASLAPEIAQQCITLMAPSKTFNIPGLYCGFAIVQNPALRKQLVQAAQGLMPQVNLLGFSAALGAYAQGQSWLDALLDYLRGNREFVTQFIRQQLPNLRCTHPEATYLTWIDCREAKLPGNAHEFFLKEARVALNDGRTFGPGGEDLVRLNFGCSRATLEQALIQMKYALERAL